MKKNKNTPFTKKKSPHSKYRLFRRSLTQNRPVNSAFSSVYGINKTLGTYISASLGFSPYAKLKNIPLRLWNKANHFIDKTFLTDRQLTRKKLNIIAEHVRNGSYKGLRFLNGLPVHGQRTHSNARTARRLFRGSFSKPVKQKGEARQQKKAGEKSNKSKKAKRK